jgi:hypothetical protein
MGEQRVRPEPDPAGLDVSRLGDEGFPFQTEFSLGLLIDFWTQAGSDSSPACAAIARLVAEQLRDAPALAGVIGDPAALERHRDLVDLLMSAEIPPALWEQAHAAAMLPFHLRGLYATPSMRRDLMHEDGRLRGRVNLDASLLAALRRGYAYALVLRRLYGVAVDVEYPLILTVVDPASGLDRHFRLFFDGQFVDVDLRGPLPPLPDDARAHLQARLLDPGYLEGLLPPERFLLRGVTFLKAIEVTDQEVLSALKRDLIDASRSCPRRGSSSCSSGCGRSSAGPTSGWAWPRSTATGC